jgi:hypothetical protein
MLLIRTTALPVARLHVNGIQTHLLRCLVGHRAKMRASHRGKEIVERKCFRVGKAVCPLSGIARHAEVRWSFT